MLKLGYFLMIAAGVLLGGYAAYLVIRTVAMAPGLGLFFKITIVGLIIERRRDKDDYSDDGDD